MVNPWTTLQGPVDWTTKKKEVDTRALNQVDRNIANVKEQGRQYVAAAGVTKEFLQTAAQFSGTLASALIKDDADKQKAKDAEEFKYEAKLADYGIENIHVKTRNQAKAENWADNEVEKKLRSQGLKPAAIAHLMKMGERETKYSNERALRQFSARLDGYMSEDQEFNKNFELYKNTYSPDKLKTWVREQVGLKYQDALGVDYTPEVKLEILEPSLKKFVEGKVTEGEIYNSKSYDAETLATTAGDYKDAADANIPNGLANIFHRNVKDYAQKIPKTIKIDGEEVHNPDWDIRWKLARGSQIEVIQKLIDSDQISMGQLADLEGGLIPHDGFVSKDNPEGLVTVGKALFEHDGSTLRTLTDRAKKAKEAIITEQDERKELSTTVKVNSGLKRIINDIKEPKAQLAAFDQLVTGLGGLDSPTISEETRKKLKAQSKLFKIKDKEANFKTQLMARTLTKDDLNVIKDNYPGLYAKFKPLVEVQERKDFKGMIDGVESKVAAIAGWSLDKPLEGNEGVFAGTMQNKLTTNVMDALLALPPEELTSKNITATVLEVQTLFERDWEANGGGTKQTDDALLTGLYAYNSRTKSFPLWNAKNLGFQDGETIRTLNASIKTDYEKHGDEVLTMVHPDDKTSTLFFSTKEFNDMNSNGAISTRAKHVWASLPTKVKNKVEGGLAGFIRSQGELVGVDLSEATKPAEEYYNLTVGDPYIHHLLNSDHPMSVEAFNRGEILAKEAKQKEEKAAADKKTLDNLKEQAKAKQTKLNTPVEKEVLRPNHPLLQEGAGTRTQSELFYLIQSVLNGEQDLTELSPEIQAIVNQFKLQ